MECPGSFKSLSNDEDDVNHVAYDLASKVLEEATGSDAPTNHLLDENLLRFDFLDENKPGPSGSINNASLDFHQNGKLVENEDVPEPFNMELLRMAAQEAVRMEDIHDTKPKTISYSVPNPSNGLDRTLTIPYLDLTQQPSFLNNFNYSPFLSQPVEYFQNLPGCSKPVEPVTKDITTNSLLVNSTYLQYPPPNLHSNEDVAQAKRPAQPSNYGSAGYYVPNGNQSILSSKYNGRNNFNTFARAPIHAPRPILSGNSGKNYVKNDTPTYSLLQRDNFSSKGSSFYPHHLLTQMPKLPEARIDMKVTGPSSSTIQARDAIHISATMADLFTHLNHRTMRMDNPSQILQVYLECCYEQWSLLEVERKKTEADLAIAFPGRMVSSGNNIPVPRTTVNHTLVDKLIVDMSREHSKVITLMLKMEQLRALCKKKKEEKNNNGVGVGVGLGLGDTGLLNEVTSCSGVTVLKRGEAWDDSENLLSSVGIPTPSEVEAEINEWKLAIDEVKDLRDKELFWPKDSEFVTGLLAVSIKKLASSAKKARLAMWCNLTLTKNMAREADPKPVIKIEKPYKFAALEKLRCLKNVTSNNTEEKEDANKTSKELVSAESKTTTPTKDNAGQQKPSTSPSNNDKDSSSNSKTSANSGNRNKNQNSSSHKSMSNPNNSSRNYQRVSPKRANALIYPYGGNAYFYPRASMQYYYERSRYLQPYNMINNYRYDHYRPSNNNNFMNNLSRDKDKQPQPNHNNNYLSSAPIK